MYCKTCIGCHTSASTAQLVLLVLFGGSLYATCHGATCKAGVWQALLALTKFCTRHGATCKTWYVTGQKMLV